MQKKDIEGLPPYCQPLGCQEEYEELMTRYLNADFREGYVGYFEIPQESAQCLALFIRSLENELRRINEKASTRASLGRPERRGGSADSSS